MQITLRQGFYLRVCADYIFIKSCDNARLQCNIMEGNIPDLLAFAREGNYRYARNSARRCQCARCLKLSAVSPGP